MKTVKTLLFVSVLFAITAESCAQKNNFELTKAEVDSLSYAIGVDYGNNLKNSKLTFLSIETLENALTSVVNNELLRFDNDQAMGYIQSFFMNLQALEEPAIDSVFGSLSPARIDSLSYALGINLAENFKEGTPLKVIDLNTFLEAMKAVLADSELRFDSTTSRAIIQRLMRKQQELVRQQQELEKDKTVAKNKKTEEAFLKKNKKAEGVVALPSGLQYKILTEGTGIKPTAADTVEVHYKGTLLDEREFDSSYKYGQPAKFPLSRVIKGWTEGFQQFGEGTKAILYIPSELAYGAQAPYGSIIEPGATLIFEVELLKVFPGPQPEEETTEEVEPVE
ncbi:MAG: FKBP-type peptidyl-prolyl cis-trans isomerase [Prevotellaceae bacterium]|nr:FKBP-type peptidyl-prolyl cis-trans isomerase [Prevotellaceae bacterium]